MITRAPKTSFPSLLPEQKLLLGAGMFAGLALAFALVSQLGFGLHPCDLCIKQRIPYIALALMGAGALFLRTRKKARVAACIAFILMLIEAGIAWYHAGVEKGVFKGPDACSGGSKPGDSLEELRRQIMEAPLVSCSQAMAQWLGLSMAAWNGVLATLVLVVMGVVLWRTRR